MAARLREEFRLRCVSLNHPDYASFAKSKWMSGPLYLVYRWVLALFITLTMLTSRSIKGGWYTPYFTGWGLATITIYFDLAAFLCSYQFYKSRHQQSRDISMAKDNNDTAIQPIQHEDQMHPVIAWGYRIMWMLFNIAAVNSLIVSIGYWGLIYHRYGDKVVGRSGFFNLIAHLFNAVFMLMDAAICPLPIRILHWVYSNLYGLLYIAATLIQWLISGRKIVFYEFLDYSQPEKVVITFVLCFFIIQPLFQFLFYGIYRLREWIQAKRSRDQLMDDVPMGARSDQSC